MRRSAELSPAGLWRIHPAGQALRPRWRTMDAPEAHGPLADTLGLASLLLVVVLTLLAAPALEPSRTGLNDATVNGDEASTVMLVSPLVLPDGYEHDDAMPGLFADLPALPLDPELAPNPVSRTAASLLLQTPEMDALGEEVDVLVHEASVSFRIDSETLFASGKTRLTPAGVAVLDKLVEVLARSNGRIAVEGHSDTVPIHTAQFPSNWELSANRAASVLRYLLARGIAPERLRATGYADTRPIAENDTPAGRAVNRRVELVLETLPTGAGQDT